jgi:hypothetical protein
MVQVAILAFISLFLATQQGSGVEFNVTPQEINDEEVANWATAHYKAAQEILLSFKSKDNLGADIEWRLIVLITPPWDPESRLEVTRGWDGKVYVSLSRPEGRSIYKWLEDIHRRNRNASLAEVIRQIAIQEEIIDTDKCPKLKPLIDMLKHIEVSLIPWSGLKMDPINYQIRCQTQMNSVDLSLINIDHLAIIKWIEKLMAVLKESCGLEKNKKKK